MAENQEFLARKPQVVAVGGTPKTEHRPAARLGIEVANQGGLERLQQAGGSLLVDPAVVLEHRLGGERPAVGPKGRDAAG